jgi:hypothetical protein
MECADAELLIACLLDALGDHPFAWALRLHLTACDQCRELWANMLLVRAMEDIAQSTWGKKSPGLIGTLPPRYGCGNSGDKRK